MRLVGKIPYSHLVWVNGVVSGMGLVEGKDWEMDMMDDGIEIRVIRKRYGEVKKVLDGERMREVDEL